MYLVSMFYICIYLLVEHNINYLLNVVMLFPFNIKTYLVDIQFELFIIIPCIHVNVDGV